MGCPITVRMTFRLCPGRLGRFCLLWALAGGALGVSAHAGARVLAERKAPGDDTFQFSIAPSPARNDAAARAVISVVAGEPDPNGGGVAVLQDGLAPADEDQPAANFFFRAGTDGGRLLIDLGALIRVERVSTFSWHPGSRGPQVYTLYGWKDSGSAPDSGPLRDRGRVPAGWEKIARVDTRSLAVSESEEAMGGQYAVAIQSDAADAAASKVMGRWRHLLLDVEPTQTRNPFGNTFFSEIDVIDADGPPLEFHKPAGVFARFETRGGGVVCRWTLDATVAPDLLEWAETTLRPVIQEWYPKLIAMLPSEGFQAPTNIVARFRDDMGGTPASAGRGRINLNARWMREEKGREALGAVVHEMVHIVQDYRRPPVNRSEFSRPPGWLVEGIADYIRWFLYEPESRGAEITSRNLARARHDASYRITANFLNWVTEKHDKEIVPALNAAAREGRYSEKLWKERTGQTLEELGAAWRKEHEERLGAGGGQ
jgi:hypothetical protein